MEARNSARDKMDVRFLLATTNPETTSTTPDPAASGLQDAQTDAARPRPNSDYAQGYNQHLIHVKETPQARNDQDGDGWERPLLNVRQRVPPDNDTPPYADHDRTTSGYNYHTNGARATAMDDASSSYTGSFNSGRPASPDSTSDTTSHSDQMTDNNKARPPRPAYNEEQRFFIMFARIVLFQSWPEIEQGFGELFGRNAVPRSRGGLTSVYYRVRKRWGLEEVLKTDNESTYSDRFEVGRRAQWMSPAFLDRIGYPGNLQTYQRPGGRAREQFSSPCYKIGNQAPVGGLQRA